MAKKKVAFQGAANAHTHPANRDGDHRRDGHPGDGPVIGFTIIRSV